MNQTDIIAKFQRVVEFAYNNANCNWYQNLCKKHGLYTQPILNTMRDIMALPFMSRTELSGVGIFNRAFTPPEKTNEIRSTSGTSGQAALFYMRDVLYHKMGVLLYDQGARRKLIFWNYNMTVSTIHSDRQMGLQTVVGDPHQLNKNINLVKQLDIDTLSGTPSVLLLFGEILKPSGLHTQIRFIETQGEPCSVQTQKALSTLFPNAKHYSQYSMGEIGQEIGLRLPACSRQDSNYYHINEDEIYVETIEGELVVTRYETPTVMPLIRYKTGDNIGWLGYDECSCGHKGLSFELLGRQNVDFVRIAGVELRNELIAAIVGEFHMELDSFIATEVSEQIINNAQKVAMNIRVVPRQPQATNLHALKEKLQNTLMKSLRVSSTTTLEEMVLAGLFAIPEITFLDKRPTGNKQPGIKLIADQDQSSASSI